MSSEIIQDGLKKKATEALTTTTNSFAMNRLREELPEYFDSDKIDEDGVVLKYGQFNLARFAENIGEDSTGLGFGLNFVGKNLARLQAGTPTLTVIAPDKNRNSKLENEDSDNVYITADNLEALKHLRNAYAGKIKLIYLDPPYNTGGDGFEYPDDFKFSDDELMDLLGIDVTELERQKSLIGKSNHAAWMTFMYPRLAIARTLLRDDGSIFISIDNNEVYHLKILMDELFGENNFKGNIIPIANPGGRDYSQVAVTNEYLLVYSKSSETLFNELEKDAKFKYFDSEGGFTPRELRNRNPRFNSSNRPNLFYPFFADPNNLDENGYAVVSLEKNEKFSVEIRPYNSKGSESVWRWGKKKSAENITEKFDTTHVIAHQKKDGNWNIYEKNRKATSKMKSVWAETDMRTEQGTRELNGLFGFNPFPHPKPLALIQRVIQVATEENDIILDIFSGSGTTGHAVMKENVESGITRKWILLQLDEKLKKDSTGYKNGYHSIPEVAMDRLTLAAEELKKESDDFDFGFKHYSVVDISREQLDAADDFDSVSMLFNNVIDGYSVLGVQGRDVLLTTWTLDDGMPFDQDIENVNLNGFDGFYAEQLGILYLIDDGWTSNNTEALLNFVNKHEGDIRSLVVLAYSFGTTELNEIKDNVKAQFGNAIQVVERY